MQLSEMHGAGRVKPAFFAAWSYFAKKMPTYVIRLKKFKIKIKKNILLYNL